MFDNELAFDKLLDSLGAETLLDNLVRALTADEQRENFDKVSSIHYESEQKPYETAIYTDGCMEYSEVIDFIDCPESIIQETAWNLFKEIRTVIHQYAPRFA